MPAIGFVTFNAGEGALTERNINFGIIDDRDVEGTESFFVTGTESAAFAEFVGGGNSDTVTVNIEDNDRKYINGVIAHMHGLCIICVLIVAR